VGCVRGRGVTCVTGAKLGSACAVGGLERGWERGLLPGWEGPLPGWEGPLPGREGPLPSWERGLEAILLCAGGKRGLLSVCIGEPCCDIVG
jgi:hypothetical protein